MEPEGSLPRSQDPVTCPCPEPDQSRSHPSNRFLFKTHENIIRSCTPRSSKWSPSLRFPRQNPMCTSFVPHTCYLLSPAYFGEEYKSWSSLCSFLQSPVTASVLGANIFLSTLFSNTQGLFSSLERILPVLQTFWEDGFVFWIQYFT
jgi:hypothetical protein